MRRQLLRRDKAVSPVIATILMIVITIVLASILYIFVVNQFGHEEICGDDGFEAWFEIVDYLDPDTLWLKLLKNDPGIPDDLLPLDEKYVTTIGGIDVGVIQIFLWSELLIVNAVFWIGCKLSGYSATAYLNESQEAFLNVIVGLILGVKSETVDQFHLVFPRLNLTVEDSSYTYNRANLKQGYEVDGLEDFPEEVLSLPLNRTVEIKKNR